MVINKDLPVTSSKTVSFRMQREIFFMLNIEAVEKTCHSRESGNPLFQILTSSWIPAFAGMTTI